jgi:beta-lactamase regulating signal transducer with metallopeptidase domain
MSDFWLTAVEWAGRSVLAGGTVLLLGWVVARLISAPEFKQPIAVWTIRAAVLVPVLCLFPAWLTVSVPLPAAIDPIASLTDSTSAPGLPVAPPDEATPAAEPIGPDGLFDMLVIADGLTVLFESIPNADDAVDRTPTESAGDAPQGGPGTVPAPPAPGSMIDAVAPLVLIPYALVVAALLGQLLAGHLGLLRLRGSAVPAPARVRDLFHRLAGGSRRPADLLVSDRLGSPVCFGLLRPTILLPRRLAVTASDAELRWVLAHEGEHLRRGDALTGWWVGVARALYFFLPWFWPLRRELALAQEYLADAAAAAADGRPVDYAAFLVDLSGDRARLPLAAFAVRAGSSDLFRRVTMLLSAKAGPRRPTRGWVVLAAGAVLAATVLLSGVGLADEKPKPKKIVVVEADDGAKAGNQAEKRVIKVKADGEKPQAGEKKPARDGDKPRVGPRDGDKPRAESPEKRRIELREMGQEVAELKKAILQAAQKGNEDEVRRLVDRLEKVLTAGMPRVFGPEGFKVPPLPPVPPIPRFDHAQLERAQAEMERAQRAFAEAIEKLKDNPEAKESLEKAQAEYRKAMELARDKMKGQFKDFEKLRDLEGFRRLGEPGAFAFGRAGGPVRFGVAVSPVSDELAEQLDLKGSGVVVQTVVPGSPAEKAGLHKNDIIVQFAGQSVSGDNFSKVVAGTKAGEKVDVVVLRKGKKETLKGIELAQAKKPEVGRVEVRPGSEFKRRIPGGDAGPGTKTRFEKMSVSVSDDSFEIDATRDDLRYRLSGTVAGGKASPDSITITEGKKKSEYRSVDDVPEKHRDAVRQLLGSVGGSR